MIIPDSLTPIAITGSILGNIATDILKHYALRLEGSLVGNALKHTGLLPKTFNDKFSEVINETLKVLFDKFPEYRVTGVIDFIKDSRFAEQLLSFLLDRKTIDNDLIQDVFVERFSSDPYTRILLNRRGIEPQLIVQSFFVCYREVLLRHMELQQIFVLYEIFKQTEIVIEEMRASDEGLKEYLSDLFKKHLPVPQKLAANSWEIFLRNCELKLDLEIRSSIGAKYNPGLYVHREIELQYDEFVAKSVWGRKSIIERLTIDIGEVGREEDVTTQLIDNISNELMEIVNDQRVLNDYLSNRMDGSPDELWRILSSVVIYLDSSDQDIKVILDTLGDELNIVNLEASKQTDKLPIYQERQVEIREKLLALSKNLSKRLQKREILGGLDITKSNKQNQLYALKRRLLEIGKIKRSLREVQGVLTNISGQKAYNDIESQIRFIDEIFTKERNLVDSLGFVSNTLLLVRKHFRNCFLVVDRAGSGKTNLLCHLANKYSKSQAVLFVSGRILVENEFSIEEYIVKSSQCPELELDFNNLSEVNDFLVDCRDKGNNRQILIFIDGINENSNGLMLKRALQRMLATCLDKDILFCVSCRDIFWDFFSDEFWDEFVFETAKDRLYNFTQKEFGIALERYMSYYRIDCRMQGEALDKCRQPLLLRFFCEAYGDPNGDMIYLGNVTEIRLKKLFDDYWDRKIKNIKDSLSFRNGRDIELFLYAVSDYMWKNRTRNIPLNEIQVITKHSDFNSDKSLYLRILDEDIILEEGSSSKLEPWVTFVYDEFMEYSIAKGIIKSLPENISYIDLEQTINKLLDNYNEFPNIEGVISYLCIILASDRNQIIWNILIDKGKPWTLVVPRSINQLTLHEISQTEIDILRELSKMDDDVKTEVMISAVRLEETSQFNLVEIWINLFQSIPTRLRAKDHLIAYANAGSEDAIKVFLENVNNSSSQLRAISIFSLAAINSVVPSAFMHRSRDNNDIVRQSVAYALQFFSEESRILIALLKDANPDVRKQACLSLKECDDINIVTHLFNVFWNDIDNEVSKAARISILYITKRMNKQNQLFLLRELMDIERLFDLELQYEDPSGYGMLEPLGLESSKTSAADNVVYLHQPAEGLYVYGWRGADLIDALEDLSADVDGERVIFNSLHEELADALQHLSEIEKQVILLRYGLDDNEGRSQEEISRALHVSRATIGRVEARALKRLRHPAILRKLRDYLD